VGKRTTYISATGMRLPKMRALVNIISTINLASSITKSFSICFFTSLYCPKLKASMANRYTFTIMKIAELPAINPVKTKIKFLKFS
jgi:hypothetical protein